MASTDAKPFPQKNVAYRVTFPIFDADGDLVTGATGLDSEISKDGGTFADCTSEATEVATASGIYYLDLTSTEMNADTVAIIVKTSSSGAKTTPLVMYPEETGDIRVNVTAYGGTAGTFASGIPEVKVASLANNAITSASINADAITAAKIADGAIDAATFATGAITATAIAADAITAAKVADGTIGAATFATGAINAAAIATDAITAGKIAADAIGASEIATDAVTEIVTAVWAATTRVLTANTNLNDLNAAGVRAAVGLASANLDTQLSTIDDFLDTEMAAVLAAVDTEVAAIKTKTDSLTFTVAGVLDANVTQWKGATAPAMTGDAFARLGAPAGASVSADVAAVKTDTAAVKAKTDNLPSDPADASDIASSFSSVSSNLTTIASYLDTEILAIKAKTDLIPASPAASGDIPSAATIADAVHDEVVDGTTTFRQSTRLQNAVLLGKASGLETNTATYRDLADTKDRIVATVTEDGNRTAITRDAS